MEFSTNGNNTCRSDGHSAAWNGIMDMRVYTDSREEGDGLGNEAPATGHMLDTLTSGESRQAPRQETWPVIYLPDCDEDSIESHIVRGID